MTRSRAATRAAPDRPPAPQGADGPAPRAPAFAWTPQGWACGGAPVEELAGRFGTPLYCYGLERLIGNYAAVARAFPAPAVVCYSVKANPNLALLAELAWAGAGFDVVSGGELRRVLRVAGTAERTVFAGVGKTPEELRQAVDAGLLMLNVESSGELAQVLELARGGTSAGRVPVALRVNPDVDARTHRHVTTGRRENKFGLDRAALPAAFEALLRSAGARLAGLHAHIGSQVESARPFAEAVERLLEIVQDARRAGHAPEWVNAGGGFAVAYDGRPVPALEEYAAAILPPLRAENLKPVLEVGRAIAADAGALVTRVLYQKEHGGRRILITDAGMTDLLRPALYGAWHRIWPAHQPPDGPGPLAAYDVAGPICESSDYFAEERELPPVAAGDLLVVFDAGAYGMSMASQYNSHPRAAEVLVSEGTPRLIRRRETFEDLVRAEEDAIGA